MSSKVLLATCSFAEKWISTVDQVNGHYPLGLGYLHSVLEEAGHEVQTMFLNTVPHDECLRRLVDKIRLFNPQVLGISMMSDSRVSSFRVIEYVHANFPDINIVLGGVHVSTMYEQIALRFPYCTLALGEAEVTLCDLVEACETGRDRSTVKGIAYFENGQVVRTESRELIEDLDILPYPKHAVFFNDQRVVAQLLTSRGCPNACTFCVLDSFSRRKVRFRSPKSVVDEIEHILQTFPQVSTIQFLDDQFFANNQRVIAICDEIVRRNIHCGFECSARFKPLCRDMILALERAGFTSVYLGLESGARSVLKRSKKGITPEDAVAAMEMFAGSNIVVFVLLIVGLPGESIETILETARFVQRLQQIQYHMYSNRIMTIFVYPGTELYEMSKRAGVLDDDFWLTDAGVPYYTVEHNESELEIFRNVLLTYISPVRLITPGGLAAQRHMLPEIIRFSFNRRDLRPVVNLVMHAAQALVKEGQILFTMSGDWAGKIQTDGFVHISALSRELGTDNRYQMGFKKVPIGDTTRQFVEFAYKTGYHELSDKITTRVVEILTQYIEHAPGADELLGRLGFTEEWMNAWLSAISLRL